MPVWLSQFDISVEGSEKARGRGHFFFSTNEIVEIPDTRPRYKMRHEIAETAL